MNGDRSSDECTSCPRRWRSRKGTVAFGGRLPTAGRRWQGEWRQGRSRHAGVRCRGSGCRSRAHFRAVNVLSGCASTPDGRRDDRHLVHGGDRMPGLTRVCTWVVCRQRARRLGTALAGRQVPTRCFGSFCVAKRSKTAKPDTPFVRRRNLRAYAAVHYRCRSDDGHTRYISR